MNKSEAAEALYRAGCKLRDTEWGPDPRDAAAFAEIWHPFCLALNSYRELQNSTATPDAVPPEVQRVVEAAVRLRDGGSCGRDWVPFCEAVDAYRASQPEPLSARLARLGKGAVVEVSWSCNPYRVHATLPELGVLVCERLAGDETAPALIEYGDVVLVLTEAP